MVAPYTAKIITNNIPHGMPEIQLHQYMYQLSQLLQQLYPIHDPQ
jgi:hypothetical protein